MAYLWHDCATRKQKARHIHKFTLTLYNCAWVRRHLHSDLLRVVIYSKKGTEI